MKDAAQQKTTKALAGDGRLYKEVSEITFCRDGQWHTIHMDYDFDM